MFIDTVVTAFNRKHSIDRTINSVLKNLPESLITIVDDYSSDNTFEYLHSKYAGYISQGLIRVFRLESNTGVTGAKNFGFLQSTADWVIFLDSDDEYIDESGKQIIHDLKKNIFSPIVFFRCQDQNGNFIGHLENQEAILDLTTYIKESSFGEALTAINRKIVGKVSPYVTSLKGYEGIGCCRLISKYGAAILSKHIVRIYFNSGDDRLSNPKQLYKRAHLLARGHFLMISEFRSYMSITTLASYLIKSFAYYFISKMYNIAVYFK